MEIRAIPTGRATVIAKKGKDRESTWSGKMRETTFVGKTGLYIFEMRPASKFRNTGIPLSFLQSARRDVGFRIDL